MYTNKKRTADKWPSPTDKKRTINWECISSWQRQSDDLGQSIRLDSGAFGHCNNYYASSESDRQQIDLAVTPCCEKGHVLFYKHLLPVWRLQLKRVRRRKTVIEWLEKNKQVREKLLLEYANSWRMSITKNDKQVIIDDINKKHSNKQNILLHI